MITFWHPDSGHAIMPQKEWHSDSWDPKSYGRDYDFSRPFFEQWGELFKAVPKPALQTQYSTMIDSEYCNGASDCKSCYLCFKFDRAEECGYCNSCSHMKNCFDVSWSNYAELCYESVNLEHCYQVFFSQDCSDCHDVWYSRDLVGCSNCYGCINLRKKSYCIYNEQFSKEEYEKRIKEFDIKKAKAFFLTQPRRQFHGHKNQNVSGDYIWNSKNVRNSYWVDTGEDIRYGQFLQALNTKNAYDYTSFSFNAEWIYECCWVGLNSNNIKFSFWNYEAHNLEYCYGCHGGGNLFGCVGLRKGEYCILNKQYSPEEYFATISNIKLQMTKAGEYGEFFPAKLSPWAYNETHAGEYLTPLTKEQALAQGFSWRDEDKREYKPASGDLLACRDCGRNYQLIGKEIQFLERFHLSKPDRCPLCRDRARIRKLNPIAIYSRTCAKCGKDIETSYSPDRPEIVYCESCYQSEIL
ncbi:MAG: hypothetical protein AAB420_04135 [Patescibacteria group bacterium]